MRCVECGAELHPLQNVRSVGSFGHPRFVCMACWQKIKERVAERIATRYN